MNRKVIVTSHNDGIKTIFPNVNEVTFDEDCFYVKYNNESVWCYDVNANTWEWFTEANDNQPSKEAEENMHIEVIKQLEDENSVLRNTIIAMCKNAFLPRECDKYDRKTSV